MTSQGSASCQILSVSEYYLIVRIGEAVERRKAKGPSRPEMANGKGEGATSRLQT